MSYAVIRTGGKQYRVREGQTLRVERIEAEPGQEIELAEVLALKKDSDLQLDPKALSKIKIKAKVVRHGRGRKIRVFKFKRRKGFHKTIGHRQDFTEILISPLP